MAEAGKCWDCGHPVLEHAGEPPNRHVAESDGCRIEGCDCRRWFEVFDTDAEARAADAKWLGGRPEDGEDA